MTALAPSTVHVHVGSCRKCWTAQRRELSVGCGLAAALFIWVGAGVLHMGAVSGLLPPNGFADRVVRSPWSAVGRASHSSVRTTAQEGRERVVRSLLPRVSRSVPIPSSGSVLGSLTSSMLTPLQGTVACCSRPMWLSPVYGLVSRYSVFQRVSWLLEVSSPRWFLNLSILLPFASKSCPSSYNLDVRLQVLATSHTSV